MFKSCHRIFDIFVIKSASKISVFYSPQWRKYILIVLYKKRITFSMIPFFNYILYKLYYIYRIFFVDFFQFFQYFQESCSDKLSHLNGQTFTPERTNFHTWTDKLSHLLFVYYILILIPSEYSSKCLIYLSFLYVWRIVLICSMYLFFFFWSESCFICKSFSVSIKEKIVSNFISSI